ncbi:hypothetical protein D3C81_174730 [compost metagenome]
MNHHLYAVRPAALIAVTDQPHIAAVFGLHKGLRCHHRSLFLSLLRFKRGEPGGDEIV